MSETKWTPGPWKVEMRQFVGGTDALVIGPSGDDLLCLYASDGADDPVALPNVANAHLIAAAPDLYEALKAYVDHFGDPLKVAIQALRKADGKP